MSDLKNDQQHEDTDDEHLPFNISRDFPDDLESPGQEEKLKPVDPLAALRQSLQAEEQQPEQLSKPDLLQRMTGTLASKKVPTRPRPQTNPETGFGVLTSRPSSSESPSQPRQAAGAGNEEIKDDFLERRLRSPAAAQRPNRPNLEKSKTPEQEPTGGDAPVNMPNQSVGAIQMPAPSPVVRRLDPLYDNAEPEENAIFETPRSAKPIEMPSRPVDDRKMLGSGSGERQFEVNRYLSYNPKQSLWGQFRSLSSLEQGLLVVLIVAVVSVASLIVYLYVDSRNPAAYQLPVVEAPEVTATHTPSAIITPVVVGNMPVPAVLELPGGWRFPLKTSTQGGQWTPTTSEWLSGTEIRRVVGLPWNRQVEAVIRTFGTEDSINLWMNNGDKQVYKVASVTQVDVQDASILHDTRPSLAIVLFNAADNKRWVVLAYP